VVDLVISQKYNPGINAINMGTATNERKTGIADTMTQISSRAFGAKSEIGLNRSEFAWMPASRRELWRSGGSGVTLDQVPLNAGQTVSGFVSMVINCVEKHLSNYKFNIQSLAIDLRMSRRQLFRKFKDFTGCTPNVFIRNARLERAAALLRNTRMTILEITYAVGFCDPKYFRAVFRNKYGMLPSVYAKQSSYGSL
jgi:AraC-like DNA-binding protein